MDIDNEEMRRIDLRRTYPGDREGDAVGAWERIGEIYLVLVALGCVVALAAFAFPAFAALLARMAGVAE